MSKYFFFWKFGQDGALANLNSESLEPSTFRKDWSYQFGEMGVPHNEYKFRSYVSPTSGTKKNTIRDFLLPENGPNSSIGIGVLDLNYSFRNFPFFSYFPNFLSCFFISINKMEKFIMYRCAANYSSSISVSC